MEHQDNHHRQINSNPAETATNAMPDPRRRGRKPKMERATTDAVGCVIHHVRIHGSLDNIIRIIAAEKKITLRDALEDGMLLFAAKHGYQISRSERQETVTKTKMVSEYRVD